MTDRIMPGPRVHFHHTQSTGEKEMMNYITRDQSSETEMSLMTSLDDVTNENLTTCYVFHRNPQSLLIGT